MKLPSIPRAPDGSVDRKALRRELLQQRGTLPPERRAQASAAIVLRLREWLPVRAGTVIGGYWPIANEPDLRGLFGSWREAGARLALPRVTGAGQPLEFVQWEPGAAMREGVHGIAEPAGGEVLRPELLIVPCVGFMATRHRLGYGGGYYDRTLAALRGDSGPGEPAAIGVAFDEAEVDDFAVHGGDALLDAIVTPTRLFAEPGYRPGCRS